MKNITTTKRKQRQPQIYKLEKHTSYYKRVKNRYGYRGPESNGKGHFFPELMNDERMILNPKVSFANSILDGQNLLCTRVGTINRGVKTYISRK